MIGTETIKYVYNLSHHDDGLKYITTLFTTQVGFISSMMEGGKISPRMAKKRIKKIYKNYKKSFKVLGEINELHKGNNRK